MSSKVDKQRCSPDQFLEYLKYLFSLNERYRRNKPEWHAMKRFLCSQDVWKNRGGRSKEAADEIDDSESSMTKMW